MSELKRTAHGEPLRFLTALAANPPSDKCVLWPYMKSKAGYGVVKHNGKRRPAHRLALSLFTGLWPSPKINAAHGPCHNPSCVNPHPEHGLRWATAKENQLDRYRDGTAPVGEGHPQSKLTDDKVRSILSDNRSSVALAKEHGVSPSAVYLIRSRKTWTHLNA